MIIAALSGVILFLCDPLMAQTVTAPVGYCKLGAYDSGGNYLGLLGNSDTLISIPFTRASEYTGTIASVSSNVVTINGATGWAVNQFVYKQATQPKTYYAQIGPGAGGTVNPKEGCIYTVSANTAGTLSLNLNGDVISSIPTNSQITLIPYWTLGTVFPSSSMNTSFTATTSTRNFQTQILIPNYSAVGVNLAYSLCYYFINSGSNIGWRLFGDATTTDHSDDILVPNGYFVVRNDNKAPTLPLIVQGSVLTGKMTTSESTLANQAQDNAAAMIRPVDVPLTNSGLTPLDGSFVATASTNYFQDQLLIYDNAQIAINKSPSAVYYYMNNGWRLEGDSTTTDHGSDELPAGSALTIRKSAFDSGITGFWQNSATY